MTGLLLLSTGMLVVEAQDYRPYSFLVAGHAYGAHEGLNTGLHPPLLARLENGLDTAAAFIVLTGDIVNHSTSESWEQVADELSNLGLPSYYVMGNHDNTEVGRQVFLAKHGALYYAFTHGSELFIVLNSTEADRAVSQEQLAFLEEQLQMAGDSTRSVFIFFHEILWNSLDKYRGVRSNSRSRYENIRGLSNYWEEVHPMLTALPGVRFYVFGGDMGGNTDAVAAFYDRWDNVTLLASGMGEVPDENCLLVHVQDSMVITELVALGPQAELPGIEYFSVPPAPDSIRGPGQVDPGQGTLEYQAGDVPYATAYHWEMPQGLTGADTGRFILLDADPDFTGGTLSVRAERDGFGTGPAASIEITATIPSWDPRINTGEEFLSLSCSAGMLRIGLPLWEEVRVKLCIYDLLGRNVFSTQLRAMPGEVLVIPVSNLSAGLRVLQVKTPAKSWQKTFILP